ncbi:uncharacterized protein SPPG_08086 [Spizellomyces punctatus DAOM BR117]|uniref:Uncharacterized protein n=1 Tax=Spizellomyces punctatus (strain DAOM BR117) TaxID=645134 RepID=A0A0L0H6F9_SPIPD|nr:uncharacterized protein SPPG_08086 [Spizellomyces punctatus DAOM BR117]KNC96496.1 hypothetical protein SPPG_08086 [Spizellomyces punctatus DAOM BR117]|eukprot:XP_016604536.1 hypothetical protein SPPG_08086 [Spizellomyces punctatus DAOM BR117]
MNAQGIKSSGYFLPTLTLVPQQALSKNNMFSRIVQAVAPKPRLMVIAAASRFPAFPAALYHHSREIKVPGSDKDSQTASSASASVPPPPGDATENFFPHFESDASAPLTSKPTPSRITKVANESSTTVEDLISLPADKIREMAGCDSKSTSATLSFDDSMRIVSEFEREAYAPKSTSAQGPELLGLHEREFQEGRVADVSDSAEVDPRTVLVMKKEMEDMAGGARGRSDSAIPEGGVRPVHPFVSANEKRSAKLVGRQEAEHAQHDDDSPRHFVKKAQRAKTVMPVDPSTQFVELGKGN